MLYRVLALAVVFLLGAADLAAGEPRPLPAFGVILNDDADLAFVVPDRAKSEALLEANVAAWADTPIRTLAYCVGMGGDLMYYDTKVASPVGWRKAPDEADKFMADRMENARVCLGQGADAVRTAGRAAKKAGLYFIPSLRMNDSHFMVDPDKHSMTSAFWFEHRNDYTIKDSPLAFQKAYGNLLDYSHEAVRQYRLATVFEVLARNEELVDGVELDFNRFQVFFPKGKAAAGAPLITELVRKVRARLDALAKSQHRPMYLFVRVPPSLADSTFAGLDVAEWMKERLVDLVSPAQIMTLAGDMPIRDLMALGKQYGIKVYPSLYPRTSWRVPFPAQVTGNRYAHARMGREATPEEIRAAAASYWEMGADGMYLFNFYSAYGATRPQSYTMYGVLRDLARPANLDGRSKVYAMTKSYYNDGPGSYAYGKQLPAKLTDRSPLQLELSVAEKPERSVFALQNWELRVGLRAVPPNAVFDVRLNGHAIFHGQLAPGNSFLTQRITGYAVKPADAAETYLHILLPEHDGMVTGSNAIALAVTGASAPLLVTDVEVRYDYDNDYNKMWMRVPTRYNQPATPSGGDSASP